MKHGKSLPKPAGARRVTKPDKTRVWVFDGMEFKSKRELYAYYSPEARMERAKAAVDEIVTSKQVAAEGAE